MKKGISQCLQRHGSVFLLCLLIAGCQPGPIAVAVPDGTLPVASTVAVAPAAADADSLQDGMSYATLRRQVLARGWVPRIDRKCRANVVGDNFQAVCAADSMRCRPCVALPELSSCSGTGHCTMQFQRAGGQMLRINIFGDVQRIGPRGEPEDLVVLTLEPATF